MTKEDIEFLEDMIKLDKKNYHEKELDESLTSGLFLIDRDGGVSFSDFIHSNTFKYWLQEKKGSI